MKNTWLRWRTRSLSVGTLFLLAVTFHGCEERHGFVRVSANGFHVNGRKFFPMVVNFIVTVRVEDNTFWISPAQDYGQIPDTVLATPRVSHAALLASFRMARDMGFNTVRILGFADLLPDSVQPSIRCRTSAHLDTVVAVTTSLQKAYLNAIDGMFDAAREVGLYVIPLVQLRVADHRMEDHFALIADRFANDTVVLAYDLFNEPLYFDRIERSKQEVHAILKRWRALFDTHAPNQLYTIGLTGVREIFEFDPNMLGVDFISFHPYEYEPDQVRNEMRWYGLNVDVPWIIGETAIPADNDSVPYDEQADFARRTLIQARACGAIGYSWWQFQDVKWGRFHVDHMGVLNGAGTTRTSHGDLLRGTPKPIAQVIRAFDPWVDPGPCLCLPNYRNFSNAKTHKVNGRLVDELGHPINEGVVLAWNEAWNESYHTISGPNGRFELRAPTWLYHWMASATRHSMDRGDCDPNGSLRDSSGVLGFELGDIRLTRLPFVEAPPSARP
jgi:Cellulase (glycosyl hydrolase family 5)